MSNAPLKKVVIVGDGGVGKSALTIQFTQHQFVTEYNPTIESSYRSQVTVDNYTCVLEILDTAGQEEYSAMRDQYINAGEGFICVYSITNRLSFETVAKLYEKICQVKDEDNIPIVIAGNKSDLENDREVMTQEGKEFAKKINEKRGGCPFLEVSAKTRNNVEDTFHAIVKEMVSIGSGDKSSGGGDGKKRRGCVIV